MPQPHIRAVGIYIAMAGCLVATTSAMALDSQDLSALQKAINSMCVQPSQRGYLMKVEGNLQADATLRVVGVSGGAKITREDWDGINQSIDTYKTDPRFCAIEVLKIIVPLYNRTSGSITSSGPCTVNSQGNNNTVVATVGCK